MKAIRYTQSFHAVGEHGFSAPVYEAGKDYPVTDETRRHVARGIAEEVDLPDPAAEAAPAPAAPSRVRVK
jgi:hypothetical protein